MLRTLVAEKRHLILLAMFLSAGWRFSLKVSSFPAGAMSKSNFYNQGLTAYVDSN